MEKRKSAIKSFKALIGNVERIINEKEYKEIKQDISFKALIGNVEQKE